MYYGLHAHVILSKYTQSCVIDKLYCIKYMYFIIIDLSLFETITLMNQCGNHEVEIREQVLLYY